MCFLIRSIIPSPIKHGGQFRITSQPGAALLLDSLVLSSRLECARSMLQEPHCSCRCHLSTKCLFKLQSRTAPPCLPPRKASWVLMCRSHLTQHACTAALKCALNRQTPAYLDLFPFAFQCFWTDNLQHTWGFFHCIFLHQV